MTDEKPDGMALCALLSMLCGIRDNTSSTPELRLEAYDKLTTEFIALTQSTQDAGEE